MNTAAAIIFVIDAVVWVVSVGFTLQYALTHKSLPIVGPIKLLSGPFEAALGIEGLIGAGLVYIVVNAFKLLAAYWLWQARLDGAILGLILIGLSAIFWYGFALPFGPVAGIAELILLLVVWKTLA